MLLTLTVSLLLQGPEVAVDRLQELVRNWFDTIPGVSASEADEVHVGAARDLVAALDQFPLEDLDIWSSALVNGRNYPNLPSEGVQAAIGSQTHLPLAWFAPASFLDAEFPQPLGVALSTSAPEKSCVALRQLLPSSAMLVAPNLQGLADFEDINPWRLRLLDALGFAFRNFKVDRNLVLLVAMEPELEQLVSRYQAVLPHFFARWGTGGEKSIAEAVPRNPYPLAFTAAFIESGAGRNFWVQALSFTPTGGASNKAHLNVKVNRKFNTIHLDGRGVYRVDLYLNNEIVDLDRPITVVRSGLSSRFLARPSARTLIENFVLNADAQALFPAMIRGLDIPAVGK